MGDTLSILCIVTSYALLGPQKRALCDACKAILKFQTLSQFKYPERNRVLGHMFSAQTKTFQQTNTIHTREAEKRQTDDGDINASIVAFCRSPFLNINGKTQRTAFRSGVITAQSRQMFRCGRGSESALDLLRVRRTSVKTPIM